MIIIIGESIVIVVVDSKLNIISLQPLLERNGGAVSARLYDTDALLGAVFLGACMRLKTRQGEPPVFIKRQLMEGAAAEDSIHLYGELSLDVFAPHGDGFGLGRGRVGGVGCSAFCWRGAHLVDLAPLCFHGFHKASTCSFVR